VPSELGWITAITAPHVLRAVRDAGGDADALAARFGIDADARYEDRIPVQTLVELWEVAVAFTKRRDLPALAATRAAHDERSLLGFLVANQPRLGDGVDLLDRYYPTISNAYCWRVVDDARHVALRVDPPGPIDRAGWRYYLEFEATDIVAIAARLTEGRIRPLAARFCHAPPLAAREALSRAIGVPVDFGAQATEIVYPRAAREAHVPSARPELCKLVAERLATLLEADLRNLSMTVRARSALSTLLAAGRATVGELSRTLRLTRRSLERALAEEGTSPGALLDDERRVRSLAWLPALGVEEVAQRLGYSDGRAFARAFRRWTAMSPTEYQDRSRQSRDDPRSDAEIRRTSA
jgi:AraC-like DNA-binding protein